MNAIRYFPLRVLALIVAVFTVLIFGKSGGEAYQIRDPENCKLHFTVLSDVHTEAINEPRSRAIVESLQRVTQCETKNDAILYLGDSTTNAQYIENLIFHGLNRLLLRDETIIPVLGNHDAGNGEGNPDLYMHRWYRFVNAFYDIKLDNPYYYQVIKGYYFIVLGSEVNTVGEGVISDEQFAWLEETLALAAESGKPAFVLFHFPPNCVMDENMEITNRLTEILSDYYKEHDVFYLCGHYHFALNLGTFRLQLGYPHVNTPSLSRLSSDDPPAMDEQTGEGIELEVYEDSVLMRGRNFRLCQWVYENGRPVERSYALKTPIAD